MQLQIIVGERMAVAVPAAVAVVVLVIVMTLLMLLIVVVPMLVVTAVQWDASLDLTYITLKPFFQMYTVQCTMKTYRIGDSGRRMRELQLCNRPLRCVHLSCR